MKKATMADVAKHAGVSKSTVSQYINNRFTYMSQATKARIKDAIDELQYFPNHTAKSLKQKKTSTIGVIVANSLHSFSSEVIHAIEEECEKNNFQIFVCNADDDSEKERNYIDILLAKQVDGLIIFPTSGNFDYYKTLKQLNFPVVFMDRKIDENLYPTFLLDNDEASNMAVKTFSEKEIDELGIVLPPLKEGVTPRRERLEGFKKALANRNHEEWIISGGKEAIQEKLEELYAAGNLPRAFFTVNDISLIELLTFIKRKRLRVPDDVSIITIDDSVFLDLLQPPITVIKQPTIEMGRSATECLLKLIEDDALKQTYQVNRFTPTIKQRRLVANEVEVNEHGTESVNNR
ncbi:LacI family DNA-binding transcriptional regulator [Lentibacillus sediminis]|uniref:LacI family DNA-binding transcriptional regulator n=1 Tax=Lentibacillus sediminis TaxID=1940529 RepID=UPI000C1BE0CE|nr:substrate-binding domain-containing protein [Lentibacillus sediminis]